MTVSWIKDIFKPTPLPCVSCSCSWWNAWRRKAHWTKILTVTTKPYCFHLYSLIEAYLVKIAWSSAWRPWQFSRQKLIFISFSAAVGLKGIYDNLILDSRFPDTYSRRPAFTSYDVQPRKSSLWLIWFHLSDTDFNITSFGLQRCRNPSRFTTDSPLD